MGCSSSIQCHGLFLALSSIQDPISRIGLRDWLRESATAKVSVSLPSAAMSIGAVSNLAKTYGQQLDALIRKLSDNNMSATLSAQDIQSLFGNFPDQAAIEALIKALEHNAHRHVALFVQKLDEDKDDALTLADLKRWVATDKVPCEHIELTFAHMDMKSTGAISPTDLLTFLEDWAPHAFKDATKTLSSECFCQQLKLIIFPIIGVFARAERFMNLFKLLDVNGNGRMDKEETVHLFKLLGDGTRVAIKRATNLLLSVSPRAQREGVSEEQFSVVMEAIMRDMFFHDAVFQQRRYENEYGAFQDFTNDWMNKVEAATKNLKNNLHDQKEKDKIRKTVKSTAAGYATVKIKVGSVPKPLAPPPLMSQQMIARVNEALQDSMDEEEKAE